MKNIVRKIWPLSMLFIIFTSILVIDLYFSFWSNISFWEGVLVELHGVIVEIVIIYFIVDFILAKREKEKWKPVMDLILYRIERIEGWLLVGFKHVTDMSNQSVAGIGNAINFIYQNQKALNNLIDLNGAGLGPEIVPRLMEIREVIESLVMKLEFLYIGYKDTKLEFDYITRSPLIELKELNGYLESLVAEFDYHYQEDRQPPTIKELSDPWRRFIENNHNFHDTPESFKSSKKKMPFCFDKSIVQELKTLTPGMQVKIYNYS
ncbi:hypothetical protein [Pleionea sediminis]|uniref:hypothetical protein n=1 Tax=Pleionea sediminis TaxID=2569479 RepID=UPI0011850AEC|nr:hypothetical protein [Pleionea sediminis]